MKVIVSQNKKAAIEPTGFAFIVAESMNGFIIRADRADVHYCMGLYQEEEKAIYVLDEIVFFIGDDTHNRFYIPADTKRE